MDRHFTTNIFIFITTLEKHFLLQKQYLLSNNERFSLTFSRFIIAFNIESTTLRREIRQINTVKPVSQPFKVSPASSERFIVTDTQDIFT